MSEQKNQTSTATVVKCMSCDYNVEREYRDGDYVMKVEGTCPKDGGKLYIAGIYMKEVRRK
jgi:hypothetical protein